MASEKFCLKWNDFESNISVAFRDLRDDAELFDVTLACCDNTGDGQKYIQAHKVILSACSPFFRNLLRRPLPNGSGTSGTPVIYLRGISHADMESVLSFMYHGEVNVAQDQLNSFLAVAEDLKVKGLTQNKSNDTKSSDMKSSSGGAGEKRSRSPARVSDNSVKKLRRPSPVLPSSSSSTAVNKPVSRAGSSHDIDDDDIQEVIPVKSEPKDITAVTVSGRGEGVAGGPAAATSGTVQVGGNEEDPDVEDYDDSQQEEYLDENYDDSYSQYSDQYLGDTSTAGAGGGAGQQINAGDAEKGSRDRTYLLEYVSEHVRQVDAKVVFTCTVCGKESNNKRNLINHIESLHFPCNSYYCDLCCRTFQNKNSFNVHNSRHHSGRSKC